MQVINPLQLNKWGIKNFLTAILSVQLLLWFLIGLDSLNIHIPILRQLIAFMYLSYIPGILILRILKQYKLNSVETTLYAVGLSIAISMFTGLFMNIAYPAIGIMPVSITPLIITISLIVMILCILCYFKDDGINYEKFINLDEFTSPYVLLLCLLPFLSIFGTYSMNLYENNLLQMVLLLIIGLMPLITIKWIPEKFYPFEIFIISISVLFHTSLISSYIWGADINTEYFYSNLVLINSYWNLDIYSNVNAMLSIVFLAPIYSIFLNLSLVWVFKIVYPALFSLVPLGLFVLFKRVTTDKIAFLSSFFFMSTSVFFNGMPALGRQEIAELFVVLLILLVLEKQISKVKRSLLAVIFTAALITSHYGTTYIFMFIIILAAIIPVFKMITLNFKNYDISRILSIFTIFSKDPSRFRDFKIMSVLTGIFSRLKIRIPKFKTKFKNYETLLVLAAITPFSKTNLSKFEDYRIISILKSFISQLETYIPKLKMKFKNYEILVVSAPINSFSEIHVSEFRNSRIMSVLMSISSILRTYFLKLKDYSISGFSLVFTIFSKINTLKFVESKFASILTTFLLQLKIYILQPKVKFKNHGISRESALFSLFSRINSSKFGNSRVVPVLTKISSSLKVNLLYFRVKFKNYEISTFEFKNYHDNLLVGNFLLFFIVLTIAWFMYVSGSSIFDNGVGIGLSIMNSITDLFNPDTSQGLYILKSSFPLFQSIERYLNIIGQIFILVGIFGLVFSKNKFNQEYKVLAVSSFLIAISGIILPFFASAMNSDRLYTITLILFAPFFVIGVLKSFVFLNKLINKVTKKNGLIDTDKFLSLTSVFLVIFFLFSSAFVYQIFDASKPGSFAINSNIDSYDLKNPEITAIKWINYESDPSLPVFASLYRANAIGSINSNNNTYEIDLSSFKDAPIKYLFLGRYEVKHNQIFVPQNDNIYGYTSVESLGDNISTIYNNGESKVLIG